MKKFNIIMTIISIAFIAILSLGISTLTLKAGPTNSSSTALGKWEEVCCGHACKNGIDYCAGTGTYICCK